MPPQLTISRRLDCLDMFMVRNSKGWRGENFVGCPKVSYLCRTGFLGPHLVQPPKKSEMTTPYRAQSKSSYKKSIPTKYIFLDFCLPRNLKYANVNWIISPRIGVKINNIWYHHLDVSENNGTPKSSILMKVFHYEPSILGIPLFLETPT